MQLVRAVRKGELEAARTIVAQDPDAAKYKNSRALRLAAGEGRTDLVRLLLENGAAPQASDSAMNKDKLWYFYAFRHLKPGEDERDVWPEMLSAFWFAAVGGRSETLKFLLTIDKPDSDELDMMLISAAAKDLTEIVKTLLDNGADIHAFEDMALLNAAENDCVETVQLLTDRGADIHAWCDAPLRLAAENGAEKTVKYILGLGTPIRIFKKERILEDAVKLSDSAEIVRMLAEYGADARFDDDRFLRIAAIQGKTGLVRTLLSLGCDIHAKRDFALRAAARAGHADTVRSLLDSGADLHADNGAAIKNALKKRYFYTAKILKDAGADCPKDLLAKVGSAQRNISAAVIYFDAASKKFLIVHPTNDDTWNLPKGGVEVGETEVQAAIRELAEETTIPASERDLIPLGRCDYYRTGRNGKKQDKDLSLFLLMTKEARPVKTLSCPSMVEADPQFPENDDFKYIRPSELGAYFGPDMARVLSNAFTTQTFKAVLREADADFPDCHTLNPA